MKTLAILIAFTVIASANCETHIKKFRDIGIIVKTGSCTVQK